jgi:hypothetical protein
MSSTREVFRCYGDRWCLGEREVLPNGTLGNFVWSTYAEIGTRTRNFASGLMTLTKSRELVGICSENRKEWFIADYALLEQSIIRCDLFFLMLKPLSQCSHTCDPHQFGDRTYSE